MTALAEKRIAVQVVETGAEAIAIFEQRIKLAEQGKAQLFKLLLFELSLPDMEATDLSVRLHASLERSSLPEFSVPFLCCCTSNITDAERARIDALKSGINYFLLKPFDLEKLATFTVLFE